MPTTLIDIVALSLGIATIVYYFFARRRSPKNNLHTRLNCIPGPKVGDKLYELVMKTSHHGMIACHNE